MLLLERAFYLILVLGTLVFVHEFGHFLAAKFLVFGWRSSPWGSVRDWPDSGGAGRTTGWRRSPSAAT
ncbi:MAG: hypothetical protein Q9Q13_02460 [Acidobacteriota bacterium]|nr:hypothetical protein [Acidobacteriota bacterium]